jgi:hypothetical protein
MITNILYLNKRLSYIKDLHVIKLLNYIKKAYRGLIKSYYLMILLTIVAIFNIGRWFFTKILKNANIIK